MKYSARLLIGISALFVLCISLVLFHSNQGHAILNGEVRPNGSWATGILLWPNDPNGLGMCTGTVVNLSPACVVTAAHCVENHPGRAIFTNNPDPFIRDGNDTPTQLNANFRRLTEANHVTARGRNAIQSPVLDIALIRMEAPNPNNPLHLRPTTDYRTSGFDFNAVNPPLSSKIYGYGNAHPVNNRGAGKLRRADIRVMAVQPPGSPIVFLAPINNRAPWGGDSGGPVWRVGGQGNIAAIYSGRSTTPNGILFGSASVLHNQIWIERNVRGFCRGRGNARLDFERLDGVRTANLDASATGSIDEVEVIRCGDGETLCDVGDLDPGTEIQIEAIPTTPSGATFSHWKAGDTSPCGCENSGPSCQLVIPEQPHPQYLYDLECIAVYDDPKPPEPVGDWKDDPSPYVDIEHWFPPEDDSPSDSPSEEADTQSGTDFGTTESYDPLDEMRGFDQQLEFENPEM